MNRTWSKIPDIWKIILVLASFFSMGMTSMAFVSGYVGLPAKVQENKEAIGRMRTTVTNLNDSVREVKEAVNLGNCLQMAEKTEGDWRQCLNK